MLDVQKKKAEFNLDLQQKKTEVRRGLTLIYSRRKGG